MDRGAYIDRLRREMRQSELPRFEEAYIETCCAYAKNLLEQKLPVLFDRQHIHQVLGMSAPQASQYHEFTIPKRNGVRKITAPSRDLKARQLWIYKNILFPQEINPCAHGFVPQRSIVSNASLHIGFPYTYCADIQDFFPSIQKTAAVSVFRELGYSPSAAATLGDLCSYRGALPQGAPTSPYLSNIICRPLDQALAKLAERYNGVFTRYADDLSISAPQELPEIFAEIEAILNAHGFALNKDKCKSYGPGRPKRITGLIVQDRVRVPKAYKRKFRQEIHYCQTLGVTAHLQNTLATLPIHYQEHLYGKAYYIKMVEPAVGEYFFEELSKIAWPE